MKKLLYLSICIFVLASCSKDDNLSEEKSSKATISFGAVLNDLVSQKQVLKQQVSVPICSESLPAYVEVVLSGTADVGSLDVPLVVEINPTPGDYDNDGEDEYFTEESASLELEPGPYTLEFFAVYNADDELIWLAPYEGGSFDWLNTLPQAFNLGAGAKKYLDVDVLCFDDRMVNEYGYLFFDIENRQAIEFCIIGNLCDTNGRHFPADYSVSAWSGTDDSGIQLYSDVPNISGVNNDGDPFSEPLCFTLPDTDGEDSYYFEISMDGAVVRSGVITDVDVRALFVNDDSVDYYHFRQGACNLEDAPDLFDEGEGSSEEPGGDCNPENPIDDCDGDGVVNGDDNCPGTPEGIETGPNGCENIQVPGRDIVVFNDNNIFKEALMVDPDNVRLIQNLVNFDTQGTRNAGNVVLVDRGKGARCLEGNAECTNLNWATMRGTIEAEGFSILDVYSTEGSLTDIPSNVKVVFLVMPTLAYSVEEINTLKGFAAEGGRIVFVGEWDGYYNHISVQNAFLLDMGAVLHNTGGAVDCHGESGFNLPGASNRNHPIMEGIIELSISCASVIEPGPEDYALFYDEANVNVLAGVAKIDTTPISEARSAERTTNKKIQQNRGLKATASGY